MMQLKHFLFLFLTTKFVTAQSSQKDDASIILYEIFNGTSGIFQTLDNDISTPASQGQISAFLTYLFENTYSEATEFNYLIQSGVISMLEQDENFTDIVANLKEIAIPYNGSWEQWEDSDFEVTSTMMNSPISESSSSNDLEASESSGISVLPTVIGLISMILQ